MAGESEPKGTITDEQLKQRLAELQLPESMLDWAVARTQPEYRQNFFAPNQTPDELLDAIEQLPHSYDF